MLDPHSVLRVRSSRVVRAPSPKRLPVERIELNNMDLVVGGDDGEILLLVDPQNVTSEFFNVLKEVCENSWLSMVEKFGGTGRLVPMADEVESNDVGDPTPEQSSSPGSSQDSDNNSVVILDAPEDTFQGTLDWVHNDSLDLCRPHECRICGDRFKQKWHLKQHKLDKHEPRQFQCLLCDRPFSRKGSRRRHSIKVHNAHFCEIPSCQQSFPTKDELFKHLGTPHKYGLCSQSNVMGRWHKCLAADQPPSPILPDADDDDMTTSFYSLYSSDSDSFGSPDSSSFLSSLSSDSSFNDTTRSWSPPYTDTFALPRNDLLGPSRTCGTLSGTTITEPSLFVAISATALVFCHAFGPENINTSRIDQIYRIGTTFHRCCSLRQGTIYNLSPIPMAKLIPGRFVCDSPELNVLIKFRQDALIQDGVELGGTFVLAKFKKFLSAFWASDFQFAILIFDDRLSFAFIKKCNSVYLFELNSGMIRGRLPTSFRKFENPELAYDHVKKYVLPSPFDEFDKCVYSIEIFEILTT